MSKSRLVRVRTQDGRIVTRRVFSGLGDFSLSPSSYIYGEVARIREIECLKTANASNAVATIDAKTEDLAKNWHPTGFYAAAEVQSIVTTILASTTQARAALASAPRSTSDADSMLKNAHAYLDINVERMRTYQTAVAAAAGGAAIDAPGLKDAVLKSMVNVSHAYTTAAVLSCQSTWLTTAATVVGAIWSTAKKIAGIAVKVGQNIITAADTAVGFIKYIPYAALALGGYWLYGQYKRKGA